MIKNSLDNRKTILNAVYERQRQNGSSGQKYNWTTEVYQKPEDGNIKLTTYGSRRFRILKGNTQSMNWNY